MLHDAREDAVVVVRLDAAAALGLGFNVNMSSIGT
jgi:hypothetical protein